MHFFFTCININGNIKPILQPSHLVNLRFRFKVYKHHFIYSNKAFGDDLDILMWFQYKHIIAFKDSTLGHIHIHTSRNKTHTHFPRGICAQGK